MWVSKSTVSYVCEEEMGEEEIFLQIWLPGRGRGSQEAMATPVPVKTSHKKIAAIGGPLYFMFLAPYSDNSASTIEF